MAPTDTDSFRQAPMPRPTLFNNAVSEVQNVISEPVHPAESFPDAAISPSPDPIKMTVVAPVLHELAVCILLAILPPKETPED